MIVTIRPVESSTGEVLPSGTQGTLQGSFDDLGNTWMIVAATGENWLVNRDDLEAT